MAIEILKTNRLLDIDQIPAELVKAVVEQFAPRTKILLILFGMRGCLRSGRGRSLYRFIRRAIKQIVVLIQAYHFVSYVQNFIQHSVQG